MIKRITLIAIVMLGVFTHSYACRYTIREIGYSELFVPKYRLVLTADTVKSESLIKDFKSIAFAYAMEANVTYNVEKDSDIQTIVRMFSEQGDTLHEKQVKSRDDIIEVVTASLGSVARERLVEALGNSFAVVLCVRGKEDQGQYRASINKAISEFYKISSHLDKKVDEQIQVIEMKYQDRFEEQILLNCLGVDENNQVPAVAVLYGRGRIAGDVLQGNDIPFKDIFNKLVLIGTDCECGVDLSPLLKHATPLSWDGKIKERVAEMLNVDVDNPMTLTEMSQILAKGTTDSISNAEALVNRVFEIADKKDISEDKAIEDQKEGNLLLWVIGGFAVAIIVVGLFLYRRQSA
ncbi:hypothetical protein EYV94_03530 [Puteibacter caeruleilacunae]|nr:hypothetical protein EYV94_03530 [Puteibacter caeruleilacunae]